MKKEKIVAIIMTAITAIFIIAVFANIVAAFFETSLPKETLVIPVALYGVISIPYVIFMIYRESERD